VIGVCPSFGETMARFTGRYPKRVRYAKARSYVSRGARRAGNWAKRVDRGFSIGNNQFGIRVNGDYLLGAAAGALFRDQVGAMSPAAKRALTYAAVSPLSGKWGRQLGNVSRAVIFGGMLRSDVETKGALFGLNQGSGTQVNTGSAW